MYKVTCKVDVVKFPFDTQTCNLTFMSWTYTNARVDLFFFDDSDSHQDVFTRNGVWQLLWVDATRLEQKYNCCAHPFTQIIYTLTLQRASDFYILSILIPSVLLTMITIMVFRMPPESGEKISLGMSNLLAFILFQQLIAGNMAPQGDGTPILSKYRGYFPNADLGSGSGLGSCWSSVHFARWFECQTESEAESMSLSRGLRYLGRNASPDKNGILHYFHFIS